MNDKEIEELLKETDERLEHPENGFTWSLVKDLSDLVKQLRGTKVAVLVFCTVVVLSWSGCETMPVAPPTHCIEKQHGIYTWVYCDGELVWAPY